METERPFSLAPTIVMALRRQNGQPTLRPVASAQPHTVRKKRTVTPSSGDGQHPSETKMSHDRLALWPRVTLKPPRKASFPLLGFELWPPAPTKKEVEVLTTDTSERALTGKWVVADKIS